MTQSELTTRIEKAAKILSLESSELTEFLERRGINQEIGIAILDSDTTTIDDLTEILKDISTLPGLSHSIIQLKAATKALKGSSFVRKVNLNEANDILKNIRPIEQWQDKELLEKFAIERDFISEQELNQRSKGQPFIVLQLLEEDCEPGKEKINIEASLGLLKNSRRNKNPKTINADKSGFAIADKSGFPIYRITELNINDRIVELCPICKQSLYNDYCEKCQIVFTNIDNDARAYLRLIVERENVEIKRLMDRKSLINDAIKGIKHLEKVWPSVFPIYKDLKTVNNLPQLRIIMNRPSFIKDPFYQEGNRNYGHKSY